MRRRLSAQLTFVAAALGAVTVVAGSAVAAHNGNNRAELSGTGSGIAIVNYSEGTGTFNGSISIEGLAPNTGYAFYVTGAGAGTAGRLICDGTSNNAGKFTCDEQHLLLPGFTTAQLRTSSGTVVISGVFERRGNCRDPDQAGSQCDAPGQNT